MTGSEYLRNMKSGVVNVAWTISCISKELENTVGDDMQGKQGIRRGQCGVKEEESIRSFDTPTLFLHTDLAQPFILDSHPPLLSLLSPSSAILRTPASTVSVLQPASFNYPISRPTQQRPTLPLHPHERADKREQWQTPLRRLILTRSYQGCWKVSGGRPAQRGAVAIVVVMGGVGVVS